MPVVLISSPAVKLAGEHTVAPLQRLGCELRWESFWPARPEDELIHVLRDVDGVVASIEAYTSRVLDSSPNLKVISRTGVGYDAVDVEAATARGVAVCTTVGSNDSTVADFAITLMLALSREVLRGHAEVARGGWNRPLAHDFFGSTVGIVGLGGIGKRLVQRLRGFEAAILAYDVFRDEAFASQNGVRYVELDELLRQSDFVSLHAPLLPATRGLIGERELNLMKPGAYLVNTARGPLIQEQALHRALKERRIAGAGIDVFEQEPPVGSPLLDPSLDNIILAPHMAGVTRQSSERSARMACESVAHILGGDAPLHQVVNPQVLQR
jgi:phosphoglycerate dehydrogenase-like enzyme